MANMKMTLPMPGGGSLEIVGDDQKALIREAAFWQGIPETCPVDGSPVRFEYRNPQGYDYYMLVSESGYEYKFGIKQDDHTLFPHGKWTYYDPNAVREDGRTGAEVTVWEKGKIYEENLRKGGAPRRQPRQDDRPPPREEFPPEEDLPFERAPQQPRQPQGLTTEQQNQRAKGVAFINKKLDEAKVPHPMKTSVLGSMLQRDIASLTKMALPDVKEVLGIYKEEPECFALAWDTVKSTNPEAAAGDGSDLDADFPDDLLD